MNEQESKIEQEHKGFLRKIANEVYELVRNTANMVRFREQVKIFCEKNEEHQREIELLEKASLADSKLQEALQKNEKKMWGKTWEEMTEGERDSIDPDPLGFHLAKPEGYEHYVYHKDLKNIDYKGYHYYGFWGPPAKTACLLEFLAPPPERDEDGGPNFWDFEFSKRPDDNEKLVCCYTLLVIIHDIQISENPIFTTKIYNGTWNLRNTWKGILWEGCIGKRWSAIPSIRIEGLSDTRAWITRALNDVKDDLAEKPAEAEQKTTPAKVINIENFKGVLGDVQAENVQTGDHASIHKQPVTTEKKKGIIIKLLKIIGAIVGFLAALFTCLGYLFGWLGPIKAFICNILWSE